MVKTAKIAVSLPKPIMIWIQKNADARYVSSNEYIRALITDLYIAAQNVHGDLCLADQARMSTNRATHNKLNLPGTKSGYKGVYPYGKRWAAVISLDGKQERIAVCATPEEAARAYDRALVERTGGDQRAAVNAARERVHKSLQVDQPYVEKLKHGKPLSDVELAAWKRTADETQPDPSSPSPVFSITATAPVLSEQETLVPPVRRQLRRGAPAIARPVDDSVDDDA